MARPKPADWKSFLLKNKWATPQLIRKNYPDFEPRYDIANWVKSERIKKTLNRDYWMPSLKMEKRQADEVLSAIFRYHFEEEEGIDFSQTEATQRLIRFAWDRGNDIRSYSQGKYLNLTSGDWANWTKKGHTATAYIAFHLFPGRTWCLQQGIMPEMFLQNKSKTIDNKTILVMMETIWIRHVNGITDQSSEEQINQVKEEFYARCEEREFIRTKEHWIPWGISPALLNRRPGYREWEKLLAEKFAVDLGMKEDLTFTERWNTRAYRDQHPERKLNRCLYTDTVPVDLHHLLARKDYPDLTYHKENVVPLNPQVHSLISRKEWSSQAEKMYAHATKEWLKAPAGEKIQTFDNVMKRLVDETYC